ncbi:DUF4432 family protein [Paenibacillaceae bacterium]|nr:DUF4432 family protein [Paenibacillaceae bacterium]
MKNWKQTEIEGRAAWVGRTGGISLTVIPELGAKMYSLTSEVTGREWLWSSGKPLGNEGYGSPFSDGDESGWDEMFPGINVCEYPDAPWEGSTIPDHGEVWSLPWEGRCVGDRLHCRVEGVKFPYTLEKVYSFLSDDVLRIDYTVSNTSSSPFSFLWAAHPLFQARPGMQLRVPDSLGEIEVSYSAEQRLGAFGDKQPWPLASSAKGSVDLSVIEPSEGRFAEKYYFTGELEEGWAELNDPLTGEAIEMRFPQAQVPYLAIWANYGGYGGHYHVAIEPATGRMDDLAYAMSRGEAAVVQPGSKFEWYIELHMKRG